MGKTKNLEKLNAAMMFAFTRHEGQYRKVSGIPYLTHVIEVMKSVSNVTLDEELLEAAILHDVIEDTDTPHERLKASFGVRVADIVLECSREGGDDVSKLQKFEFLESFADKSIESIILKISDRLCNVKDYRSADRIKYASQYAAQAYPLYRAYLAKLKDTKYSFRKNVVMDMLRELHDYISEVNPRIDIFIGSEMMEKRVRNLVL